MSAAELLQETSGAAVVVRPEGDIIARLEFLDAARGLAALWVVLFHVSANVSSYMRMPAGVPDWAWFIKFGAIGVMLFFVVSAFSLCYTMQQYRDKSAIAFYIRRLFRIAPLFYALLIYQLWRFPNHWQWPELLANMFFIFNLVPKFHGSIVWGGWTIGVEMIFYVAFPFLFRHFDNVWKSAGLVGVCFLMSWAAEPLVDHYSLQVSGYRLHAVSNFLPVFAAGMLAFHVSAALKHHARRYAIGVGLIVSALILLCVLLYRWGPEFLVSLFFDRWGLSAQGLIFAMFLVGLMFAPSAILVNRVTTFLGKLSYSIYLTHLPVLWLLIPLFVKIYALSWSTSLKFGACTALTLSIVLPASYLTYRLIEDPGIRLGRLVRSRWSSRHKDSVVVG